LRLDKNIDAGKTALDNGEKRGNQQKILKIHFRLQRETLISAGLELKEHQSASQFAFAYARKMHLKRVLTK
jgi:hypothetical protein